jgi:hypothetical protein
MAHVDHIEKESTMKRIIQGLAFAALISGAPAVWSESNFNDADAGSSIPVAWTYADKHLTETDKRRPAFDFGGTAEFASALPVTSTYADRHAGELDRTAHVQFPRSLPLMDWMD